jgi:hypothetical protein
MDIKCSNFADKHPSFLNLLVHHLDEFSGDDLWRMIPTTMHSWWFSSLTKPVQRWSSQYVQQISLSHPPPIFDNRTTGPTAFLNDVESCNPG